MKATTRQRINEAWERGTFVERVGPNRIVGYIARKVGVEEAVVQKHIARENGELPIVQSNPAKRARSLAFKEAKRQALWAKGEKSLAESLTPWERFLARISPKRRKANADMIGRWYKRTLKTWEHRVLASRKDPDYDSFIKAQKRIERQRRKKLYEERQKKQASV